MVAPRIGPRRVSLGLSGVRERSLSTLAATGPVAIAYVSLVALVWLPLGWKNGMPYETAFAFNSQTTSFWHGFFYVADPLRIYTDVSYNLGYHLSAWLGIPGSFLGFQLVYAFLWWGRGVVSYLIVARLFPAHRLFAFVVGAVVILHASDHALNWVGQMNQFGMIFWMLLGIYMLVRSLQARSLFVAGLFLLASGFFTYMSLWSYESPLFIILLVPPLLLVLRFGWSYRPVVSAGIFLLIPLIYIWDNYRRYTTNGSTTYQESVVRKDKSPGPLLSDLWFNVTSSLKFWDWGSGMPLGPVGTARLLGIAGAAVMVTFVGVAILRSRRNVVDMLPSSRRLLATGGLGLILLVASFPAYLLLIDARSMWRTQFLSGIGAALFLASALCLLAKLTNAGRLSAAILALGTAAVAFSGTSAAYRDASFHYGIWKRHRAAVHEVLSAAPRVKPHTLLVFVNVPKSPDPFGDTMWFDMAMRLAYPDQDVDGIYFYPHGAKPPSENFKLTTRGWRYTNNGYPPESHVYSLADTVVVDFTGHTKGRLLFTLPAQLTHGVPTTTYRPEQRIEPGPPSRLAVDRYGSVA